MGEEGGKLPVPPARMHASWRASGSTSTSIPTRAVAILRGAGKGFSAGGDLAMVEEMTRDFAVRARVWREARDLVYNLINCSKMVVWRCTARAVGAGGAGLLADIRSREERAAHRRPHAPGRGGRRPAAIIWPCFCGMAKANTTCCCESRSAARGRAAGLFSLVCEEAELQAKALDWRAARCRAQTALAGQVLLNNGCECRPDVRRLARLEVSAFPARKRRRARLHREKESPASRSELMFSWKRQESRREKRRLCARARHANCVSSQARSRRRGHTCADFLSKENAIARCGAVLDSTTTIHPDPSRLFYGSSHAVDALRRRRRILHDDQAGHHCAGLRSARESGSPSAL